MLTRLTFAAGLAAAMLCFTGDASAKPGRGGGGGHAGKGGGIHRPVTGGRVTGGLSKTVVTSKATHSAKGVVTSKTLVASKRVALKPAFVKGAGGVTIKTSQYAARFGVKTKGGFVAYKGLRHGHWTRKWFNARNRCWMWYCPSTCGWYYWSGAQDCYLPMRYLPVCAPTPVGDGGEPVLPPGAEDVPVATGDEVPAVPNGTEPPVNVPEPE